ncbi:RAD55 family ATPase [Haloplanus salilacus]|uniref:RAD55 family ATPase n=1 Tax=Haloplanus salilacus TaxID=2949994 RepID=UPI0030D3E125
MAEHDTRTDRYPLPESLPVDVDGLDVGTNLLISGPAMSGKRQLVFDHLAPGIGDVDPVVMITTDDPATRIRADLGDRGIPVDSDAFRIVDASGAPGDDDDPVVNRVSSPADLTGMGVGSTEVVDELGTPDRLRLGFVSISTLLQYVDSERAFSFLHVLSRRASAAGYLGVYSIDPTTHEDRFVNVVTSIFDAVVELREVDGDRELRIRGLPEVDAEWTAFPY